MIDNANRLVVFSIRRYASKATFWQSPLWSELFVYQFRTSSKNLVEREVIVHKNFVENL